MNLSDCKGYMSTATSSVPRKAGDVVSDQFPVGLRVLVVDDDLTCLMILEKMLRNCLYEVTKCNRAENALSMLRENKNGYDIVISDVHMPDMDGFKLLGQIGLEMDLPVIMMSADDGKDVVMKGVTHGACDYLIKPVRIEALKNIWQHVVRKRKNELKELEQCGSAEEGDRHQKQSEDADYTSSANEGNWRNSKKRKDEEEEEETEDRTDTSTLKKPRVVWSIELHQQFVAAVNRLGIDKAVPKKILELMNVPGLTRENVASHLQKYRLYLRRVSGVSQHQSNLSNSFISSQEPTYGELSALNGMDLQTLAATVQLPAQSIATLQAAGLGGSSPKPRIAMPVADQRNLFSFENPKLRYGEGQQHQQHLSSSRQMNLVHGIPTTMEQKQLASLHHSAQSLGSINVQVTSHGGQGGQSNSLLMQMSQPQSRMSSMLNENTSRHVPRLPSSVGQPITSNSITGGFLARNGLAENGRGTTYNPASQSSSVLNGPLNNSAELAGNGFSLGSTLGISSLTSKGAFQEEVNSATKGSGGFMPSYDIFSDLHQHKSNEWELQNIGLTFNASPQPNSLQGSLDVGPSTSPQGFPSGQRNGQNRNTSAIGRPIFSAGDTTDYINPQCFGHLNTLFTDSTVRVKTERADASSQTIFFPEQLGQDDLISTLLKQQQGGVAPAENEFDFEGYAMDNIPV